jgi:hypothetical protein
LNACLLAMYSIVMGRLLILALLLVGCADKKYWSPTGHQGIPLERAAKDCDFRASAAVAGSPDRDSVRGYLERQDLFEKCMLAKGFTYSFK